MNPIVPSTVISPMSSPASVSEPSASGDASASSRITSRPPAPAHEEHGAERDEAAQAAMTIMDKSA